MLVTTQAIYVGGTLRPVRPLALAEGETVELTIVQQAPIDENATVRRIQACQSYNEWLEVVKSLPTDDGEYDIIAALDANRRWCGERPRRITRSTPTSSLRPKHSI